MGMPYLWESNLLPEPLLCTSHSSELQITLGLTGSWKQTTDGLGWRAQIHAQNQLGTSKEWGVEHSLD